MKQAEQAAAATSQSAMGSLERLSNRLSTWIDTKGYSESAVLVWTALIVGLGTGLGAVAVRYMIEAVGWVSYEWVPTVTAGWGKAYIIIIPMLGGLIVGPLIYRFAREAKGHGVPEVMLAVALRGGRIRPVVAVVKAIASAVTIGTGGSVGREGPMVQIGSALGSSVGQMLNLSDERIRNLVACGAAAGIAATFNAPIAGVIFALELILGEFNVKYFSTVVISSVSASVVGQAVFGDAPAFPIPMQYSINSVWEFAFYPVLGALAAIVGVGFVKVLYWSEDVFASWKRMPEWLQPAIGGALLGGLALGYPVVTGITWDRIPQVFNQGYESIVGALSNELALGMVIILLVLKLLATVITLGSGGSGGVFAPSLFMGAMLGAGFGMVMNALFPGIPAPAGAYALVGMAAVFSAGAHAPITATLFLFELTGDYRIILPLMLTVVIATVLSRAMLGGDSIYTIKLKRRGVKLKSGRDVDILRGVMVSEVMTESVDTVTADMTMVELSETFNRTHHHGFPVLDRGGKLIGIVTLSDLDRAVAQKKPRSTPVSDVCTPADRMHVAYPDQTMDVILGRMGTRGLGRMPVVSREDPQHLMGIIRREDIITAYNIAVTRRDELQHRTQRMQMRHSDGTEFIEISLKEGDSAVGQSVKALASLLPEDCVLISIKRHDHILIPHGNTVFQVGDHITAFIRSDVTEQVFACLNGGSG